MHRLRHLRIPRPLGYLLLGLLLPLGFGIANAQTDSGTTETPAQEVIENYESKINVRQDGHLNVTETITVRNTEGGEIKRGIYRYFPNPDFEITSVKRNGDQATYRTEFEYGRKRIEIWKKDVYTESVDQFALSEQESSDTSPESSNSMPLTVFLSSLGLVATGFLLSYLSYRQASQSARNRPIYLIPGKQSRVTVKFFWSADSNLVVLAWIILGSLLATLTIALILILRANDIQNFENLITESLPFILAFSSFLILLLEPRFSSLRPRFDANKNRPMKRLDAETVKFYLNEPEKQMAWTLGSIKVEGWYSPENPSAIHFRIYDLPRGRGKYKYCPTCQEYIIGAENRVFKKPTSRSEGTLLVIYKCHCCDYQSEKRETIPRKSRAAGGSAGSGGAGGGC